MKSDLNVRIALQLIPYLMVMLTLCGFYYVDTKYFPVIKEFKVENLVYDSSKVTLIGTMHKIRDCEYVSLSVYGIPDKGPVVLLQHEFAGEVTKSRRVGFQTWGPWIITVPLVPEIDRIEVAATHRCLGPWTQTAVYTNIDIRNIK